MTRHKEPSRDGRLQQLKAFGLFVLGTHTLYEIAEKIGIAQRNPSTAAGRARTKVAQGWKIIVDRKVSRWDRFYGRQFPLNGWQTLSGARLWTHPRAEVVPPSPIVELTPLERLLQRLEDVERDARADGFHAAAEGLRNMRAALRYNEKSADASTTRTAKR
jgi:hypothetical protein